MNDLDLFRYTAESMKRIDAIKRDHNRRLNKIRRQGHRAALITCPLIALWFALLAWLNFRAGGDFGIGIVDSVGAIAFLLLLASSFVFNRQR